VMSDACAVGCIACGLGRCGNARCGRSCKGGGVTRVPVTGWAGLAESKGVDELEGGCELGSCEDWGGLEDANMGC